MRRILDLKSVVSGNWDSSVSLEMSQGDIAVIIGANGSGKTTFLNTVAGIVPVRAGSIVFEGRDITGASLVERTRMGVSIALSGRRIFPSLTVRDNLCWAPMFRKMKQWRLSGIILC